MSELTDTAFGWPAALLFICLPLGGTGRYTKDYQTACAPTFGWIPTVGARNVVDDVLFPNQRLEHYEKEQ